MGTVSPRRPIRPYVHVFQLGPDARVGATRVPPTMTAIPCFVYRAADAERARHLDAIAEPAVDDALGELVFQAIEGVVERRSILQELCTDAELSVELAPAHTNGCHAGASMEQAIAALAKGGFAVHVVDGEDPWHRDDPGASALDALERHLDLASLEVLLRSIAARDEELPVHAASASEILEGALERPAPEAFAVRAAKRLADRHPELLHTLLLLAARLASDASGERVAPTRALLAALPTAKDGRVKKAVAAASR